MTPCVKSAIIFGRSSAVLALSITVCANGARNAPPTPCTTRNATICPKFCANPHKIEAIVNAATENVNTRRMPTLSTSHPPRGSATAEAST